MGRRIIIQNNLVLFLLQLAAVPRKLAWRGHEVHPRVLDYLIRGNEVCYSYFCALYFDSDNQGNVIDGNICHDNSDSALFDEFSYDKTPGRTTSATTTSVPESA